MELVSFRVGEQWFGVTVEAVQEVLANHTVARVPLAPPEVAGLLNLRGQLVTAMDMHRLVGSGSDLTEAPMSVVVRDGDEMFSLLADEVGDVVAVSGQSVEPLPSTLDTCWRGASDGLVRWPGGLLAILDPYRLLHESVIQPSTHTPTQSPVNAVQPVRSVA